MGITVAVTGPTGEIGLAAVAALEREPGVERIVGMARREFDPSARGWQKTEYRRGDILDRAAVDDLVAEADVVVHLAFLIMGSRERTHSVNLAGARNVFEATAAAARPKRLVYTSSVAAYGFDPDHPDPLTEDVPAHGSEHHYYAQQKAETERMLADVTAGSDVDVYVLRPCIVAGPEATALADFMPWNRLGTTTSQAVSAASKAVPLLKPVFPDPGVRVQLVHHDDVAAAIVATALGWGPPGPYNLAGPGTVSFSDILSALGGRAIPVPQRVAAGAAEMIGRIPGMPSILDWVEVGRTSVVMDTTKAQRELGWRPRYTSQQTLATLGEAVGHRPAP